MELTISIDTLENPALKGVEGPYKRNLSAFITTNGIKEFYVAGATVTK